MKSTKESVPVVKMLVTVPLIVESTIQLLDTNPQNFQTFGEYETAAFRSKIP